MKPRLPDAGASIPVLVGLMTGLAAPALAQDAMPLPDDEGKALVVEVCSGCHDTGKIVAAGQQSAANWRDIVLNMVSRGAQIFPDEVDVIVDYLAGHFGPQGGKAAPTNPAVADRPVDR